MKDSAAAKSNRGYGPFEDLLRQSFSFSRSDDLSEFDEPLSIRIISIKLKTFSSSRFDDFRKKE